MEDEGSIPEESWENYESGPFCRHWGDPSDCDQLCVTCGHRCHQHRDPEDDASKCYACDCEKFEEAD